jgi:predicted nucleic acid-binding protein
LGQLLKEEKYLTCVLVAKADFVVSGGNHLLELENDQGMQIVNTKIFVKKLKAFIILNK